MNKIEYPAKPKTVKACDMKCGQVGIMKLCGELVIKEYRGMTIRLSDGDIWGADCPLEVELLPPGTTVTMEVNCK